MKTSKNAKVWLVLFAFAASFMMACATTPPALPETTGEELGVYLLDGKLVDAEGNEYLSADGMAQYYLDAAGNVVTKVPNKKGKMEDTIVVSAGNMTAYTYITELTAEDSTLKTSIPLFVLENGAEIYQPQDASLKFTVGPDTAMNEKFMMKTTDSNTLVFVVGGEEKDELELEGIGEHTVNLKVKYSGDTKIIVGNAKGDVIGFFTFVSEPKKVLDQTTVETLEEEIASCEHDYRDEVVAPTEQAEGYTLHLCTKCGYSYRDTYTAKLPCAHIYAERLVAATCKEKGYTLCTCTKCGDVTRKDYTELGPHAFEDKIVSPTCAAEGYTLHTCKVCGFTVKDTITAKIAHQYEARVIESTCTSEGYTIHTCKVCQANYKDNYTAVKPHSYTGSVIAPTYTTEGYTNHVCSVCGSSYKDAITPKLVCTNHQYIEVGRTPPTCANSGVIKLKCSVCGANSSQAIPATGHSYSDSIVQPTCTAEGHTTHTCSSCGNSYTDTTVPALGHLWVASEQRKQIGSEEHTFCSVCGLDFTATGTAIAPHSKAHALAGEGGGSYSNLVPIYDTVTIEVCSRCGAVRG